MSPSIARVPSFNSLSPLALRSYATAAVPGRAVGVTAESQSMNLLKFAAAALVAADDVSA